MIDEDLGIDRRKVAVAIAMAVSSLAGVLVDPLGTGGGTFYLLVGLGFWIGGNSGLDAETRTEGVLLAAAGTAGGVLLGVATLSATAPLLGTATRAVAGVVGLGLVLLGPLRT